MKIKTKRQAAPDDQSVSLGTFAGINLRLTSQNTLFATDKKGVTAWPYLRGNMVHFDITDFQVPKLAWDKIRSVLLKQQEIRKQHELDFDEDEAAFTWNWRALQ